MPRRFLFSTTSGYGHLHPLVPLARALQEAGHAVAFAARDFIRARVEATGFPFFPVGSDRELDAEYQAFKQEREKLSISLEGELIIYNRLFCGIAPRLMAPGLVDAGRAWGADMFIREGGEYGAVIAAEALGVPHATVSFTTALKGMAVFEQKAAARLDPIRKRHGLPPDPDFRAPYRYLHLTFAPPGFGTQEVDIPGTFHSIPATTRWIRPQFYDRGEDESLPAWFAGLPEQPTIYVTLGTEVNNEPELYPHVLQTIVEGLRSAPVNLIVTLGSDKDPAEFGLQPDNVHMERYIPQTLLLPHCDLMVMHGGSNTLLATLDLGLPLVIVPLIADQYFNAHISEHIGLGEVVRREVLTPHTIRAAVDRVLYASSYRKVAARLQAEMHALPGLDHAIELVETIAAGNAIPALSTNIQFQTSIV